MAPPAPLQAPLAALTALISHCRSSLRTASTTPTPDPLSLLHDAATLAKAHTTRLSVALRPPITLDAAQKFLSELATSIIPSLVAGAASLDPVLHGAALTEEGVRAVDALLGALEEFVGGVGNGADRLVGTGVVWSAADRVVELRALGQTGVVAKAVETCAEMVGDAFTELKEWVESEDLDGSDSEGDGEDAEQEFWDRPTRKGRLDEVTKEAAEGALKKLKLVTILFGAARKRRLVGEGALGVVGRVDAIAVAAKEVSAVADDLGVAYFEEEELEDANLAKQRLCAKAAEMAGLCVLDSRGEKDGYSAWFENCKAALEKST